VAIGAWVTERVPGRRLAFWVSGSALMALTIVLSFRRTGWFGLIAALMIVTVVLLGRHRRSLVLIPGLFALVAAVGVWSYTRFSSGGGMFDRLFPDVVSRAGPTRQDEWALAWRAIVDNPILGDLTARRAASLFAFWPTNIVHNAFLFAWMHLGLAGLLSLTVLAAACVAYAIRGVRARGAEEHIALGALGVVPFTLLLAMFETPLIELRTMFILALAGALAVGVATALDEPSEALKRSGGSGLARAHTE
jgi:O-antigen ligase